MLKLSIGKFENIFNLVDFYPILTRLPVSPRPRLGCKHFLIIAHFKSKFMRQFLRKSKFILVTTDHDFEAHPPACRPPTKLLQASSLPSHPLSQNVLQWSEQLVLLMILWWWLTRLLVMLSLTPVSLTLLSRRPGRIITSLKGRPGCPWKNPIWEADFSRIQWGFPVLLRIWLMFISCWLRHVLLIHTRANDRMNIFSWSLHNRFCKTNGTWSDMFRDIIYKYLSHESASISINQHQST